MTKVTLHYRLARPLSIDDYPQIANAHSTYGIVRIRPESPDKLTVDYDASRLRKTDVERVLATHGLPVAA